MRDMVVTVEDVIAGIQRGMTLERVKAARPASRANGSAAHVRSLTTDDFVEAVYESLGQRSGHGLEIDQRSRPRHPHRAGADVRAA
jgi:hypothetical protein